MSKVYVVKYVVIYEGSEIEYIFTNEKDARAKRIELDAKAHKGEWTEVEGRELE